MFALGASQLLRGAVVLCLAAPLKTQNDKLRRFR
jgi:hypothetical protein